LGENSDRGRILARGDLEGASASGQARVKTRRARIRETGKAGAENKNTG
jgi:hypothetical protein